MFLISFNIGSAASNNTTDNKNGFNTPKTVKSIPTTDKQLKKIVTNKFEGKNLKDICKKYLDELDIELFGEDLDRIVNISFDIFKLKEKQTEENLKFIKEKYKL